MRLFNLFFILLVILLNGFSFSVVQAQGDQEGSFQKIGLQTSEWTNFHKSSVPFFESAPEWGKNGSGETQVGLYDGPGSWPLGKEHLKKFFQEYNFSYQSISKEQILNGFLREGKIQLLVMPGGASWEYLDTLKEKGAQAIKDFVAKGGRYIGICAGAFYATSARMGGAHIGAYGIGLLDGIAFDGTALEAKPFKEGMIDFDFYMKSFQQQYRIVLLGGPSFFYSEKEEKQKNIQVLSRLNHVEHPLKSQAVMITFNYQKGKVFLTGPHLEVEEKLTDWGSEYQDPDTEWPVLNFIVQYLLSTKNNFEEVTTSAR